MPGDFLRRAPQLTMEQFHAFRDERPKEKKWELIDGLAVKEERLALLHQRIASNLQRLLNARLGATRTQWQADRSVQVWLEGDEKYNPEPDVTVIDAAIAMGQIFVAEVLSENDKKAVLDAKLAYYKEHDHNRCVLFVRQDQIGAQQHDRRNDGSWSQRTHTPLDPFASH